MPINANDPQILQRNAANNGFVEVNGAANIRAAINAESPEGAQAKADTALTAANEYTDAEIIGKANRLSLSSANPVQLYDDFDRSDRTLSGDVAPSGQTWFTSGTGASTVSIQNRMMTFTANSYAYLSYGSGLTSAQASFSFSDTESDGVLHLSKTSGDLLNMLHLQIFDTGWSLDKRVGGTWSYDIASGAHRVVLGHDHSYTMGLEVDGTTVTVVGIDGLRRSVTVADITSIDPKAVGVQGGITGNGVAFHAVSAGKSNAGKLVGFGRAAQADISDIRGVGGVGFYSYKADLIGPAGWYRISNVATGVGTLGVGGKMEISAVDGVGRLTFGEVALGSQFDGNMTITKLWGYTRFDGSLSSMRISRDAPSLNVAVDVYKVSSDDIQLNFRVFGRFSMIAAPAVGATALPTESKEVSLTGPGFESVSRLAAPSVYAGETIENTSSGKGIVLRTASGVRKLITVNDMDELVIVNAP